MHTYPPVFRLPFRSGHHRALSGVPWATQKAPLGSSFPTQCHSAWCQPRSLAASRSSFPLGVTHVLSTTVSVFLPGRHVHLCRCPRFYALTLIHNICSPLAHLLRSVWQFVGPSMSLQIALFHFSFYSWVIFHCIHVPHLCPLLCQWTLSFFHVLVMSTPHKR